MILNTYCKHEIMLSFRFHEIEKFLKSNHQHHIVLHDFYMSITNDRFRPCWVSSGGFKKHTITNMLSLNHSKFAIVCKMMMKYKVVSYSKTFMKGLSFKDSYLHSKDKKSHRSAQKGVFVNDCCMQTFNFM